LPTLIIIALRVQIFNIKQMKQITHINYIKHIKHRMVGVAARRFPTSSRRLFTMGRSFLSLIRYSRRAIAIFSRYSRPGLCAVVQSVPSFRLDSCAAENDALGEYSLVSGEPQCNGRLRD
jgi:hypothetical protein